MFGHLIIRFKTYLTHPSEYGAFSLHQLFRRVHLSYVPIFENQDPVVVQHCVQTVGDGDNCAETERERVRESV